MPRNASGSYTLPSGNPVVSGTLIDATWANNTLADLGNEVTDSLSRSGEGAMLAPLRITDGVQATPSLAFSNEPSSGLYRAGSNEWWAVAAGVQNLRFTNTGLTTRAAAGAVGTPSIAAFNDTDTGIYFPGANELAIATGGAARMTFDSAGAVAVPGTFSVTGNFAVDTNVLFVDAASNNVGIGTASPGSLWSGANRLVVGSGSAAAGLTIYTSTSTAGTLAFGDGTTGSDPYVGYVQYNHTDNTMSLGTSGTTKAYLDSSGNLGLGVTPSLWNSDYKALNIGSKGIVYGRVASQETAIGANWYRTTAAAFVYASNGFATFYAQDSGNHTWHIAPNNTSGAGATASFTQAMTLDASGNLGVGTTTPASGFRLDLQDTTARLRLQSTTGTNACHIQNNNTGGQLLLGIDNSAGSSLFGVAAYAAGLWYTGNYPLVFGTNNTERGRFTAGGFFKASNTGTYASSTSDRHELRSDKNDINVLVSTTSTGSSVVNLYSQFPAGPNAGAYHFAGAISGSGYQFTVDADGDVKNTNGSYAAISDLKLKQDIEDAASQWDDIKSVRVRKYRFKRTPDAPLQIGVIAQELEQTSPGLVSEDADRDEENNDLGTTTKSVKYSILYMKAIKALQEAMARIEQLEADMAALKASA